MYGVFWDNDVFFNEKWNLKFGARVDRAEVNFEDKVPTVVDESRNMFSYSIAPSYHFSEKAMVYVSAGRNYWFPTPRYYAWAVERGGTLNPVEDLEPEEVMTWELGYKHVLSQAFTINATLYYSDYKDKFGSVYEGTTSHGQGNIGDAEAKGIELEADGRPCSYFGYRLAAAYQDIEWTSGTASVYLHPDNTRVRNADISGKQIYWVPEFSGFVGLDFYPVEGLKVSVDINYMGERYVDYLNQIEYPDKTTVDARIAYTWKHWKVWVLGKNLFDEEIEYVSNSSGQLTEANGEPLNYYYVQDGPVSRGRSRVSILKHIQSSASSGRTNRFIRPDDGYERTHHAQIPVDERHPGRVFRVRRQDRRGAGCAGEPPRHFKKKKMGPFCRIRPDLPASVPGDAFSG